jgi:hypothetical protein
MINLKVIEVKQEGIKFEDGTELYSNHDSDCCEDHYLSFGDITIDDFEGLEFDLSGDSFFKRIAGYGIELIPIKGHSIRVPGYAYNNGFYSDKLELVLSGPVSKQYEITECQEYKE